MIATGGLLRMNRRQDSLRAKNRAENKRKRKSKKKKKNDVVVVKGKLNLCSPAGLVAAVGVVVLMVGVSMAVLGYWPSPNQQDYQGRRRTAALNGNRVSFSKAPPLPSNSSSSSSSLERVSSTLNQSHANGSEAGAAAAHCGFLCDFLNRYLYSDNLKVFGPLVMGIGIFLFICANAVLHENRDKKTKIINLRDIYSTVIDLHSIRAKEYSPLNGLVNYTQARSAEAPPAPAGSLPAAGMLARGSWPSAGLAPQGEPGGEEAVRRQSLAARPSSWSRDVQTFTDTVYSIYKDYSNSGKAAPQPRQWETTSIVTSSVNAFTLPVIKLNNCEVEESGRAEPEGRSGAAGVVIEALDLGDGVAAEEADATTADRPRRGPEDVSAACQQGAPPPPPSPQPQPLPPPLPPPQLFPPSPVARAMGSRLSLNSLTEQPRAARRCSLSVSVGNHGDRGRRFSCPRLERTNSKGYIKLTDLGGESFEAPDTDTSLMAAEQEVAADAVAAAVVAAAVAAAEEEERREVEEEAAAAAQGEDDLVTPSASADT